MIEEFYYLNQCDGDMEKRKGWMKQEFRLFRDGEVWCPRHNRFEYIWSDREGVTTTSRQCQISGFPIKYEEEISFYGCRILQHNNEAPLLVSFYAVIRKVNHRKIKLLKREIRLILDAVKGKAQLIFPGLAALRLDASVLKSDPDGIYRKNALMYNDLDKIGYDMPDILQDRIIQLMSDSIYRKCGVQPQAQSSLKGFRYIFSFIDRPFEPNIAAIRNFAGRHFDEMFPRYDKDNYGRICTYIGLNEGAAGLFKPMFVQSASVIIMLRIIYELGISDERTIIEFIQQMSSLKNDRIFLVPFECFQLLPAMKPGLTIAEITDYDYEGLYCDICEYSDVLRKRSGDRELLRVFAENSGIGHFKETWIVGDILAYYNKFRTELSLGLCDRILDGKLDIDTYIQVITELHNKDEIDFLQEPEPKWQRSEGEVYSYRFIYVRTGNGISRIESTFDIILEDESEESSGHNLYIAVFLKNKLECVMVINERNVNRIYSSEGEKVTGRLRTACRTWTKKNRVYSDIIDRG